MYYLMNRAGKKLSQFDIQQTIPKLVYRKNDWIIFSTIEEASNYLTYILKHNVGKNLEIMKSKGF